MILHHPFGLSNMGLTPKTVAELVTWVEMLSPFYSQARAVCVLKVSCVLPFVCWSPVSCCLCVGLLCLAVYVLKVSCVLLFMCWSPVSLCLC